MDMNKFFLELQDRLQHVEQISRKNNNSVDVAYANGIKKSMKIIKELKEKYEIQ